MIRCHSYFPQFHTDTQVIKALTVLEYPVTYILPKLPINIISTNSYTSQVRLYSKRENIITVVKSLYSIPSQIH